MVLSPKLRSMLVALCAMLLAACAGQGAPLFPAGGEATASPAILPSPAPPQVLSVCLGQEPESLFLYGDLSKSAEIIRQAIYDGPIDRIGFQYNSPILEEIPSLDNGLVSLGEVEVFPGERITDAQGNITILASGVEYRPAGCSASECWEIYQSQPSVILDQVTVSFPLREELTWSDGSPLTPEDSLFSYQAAAEVYGPTGAGPARLRFAAGYDIGPEGLLQWTGLPGYLGIYSYADLFFSPLPEALWSSYSREELLTLPQTTQFPVGWGPFRVIEWVRGDHLTLEKNPSYAGASSGLPAFDYLVFRFVEGAEKALAAFSSGECQVILNQPALTDFSPELRADQEDGLLQLYFNQGTAWEQLSFGIETLGSGPRILGDPAVRQALARCINRELISNTRLDAGMVVDSFYLPGDERFTGGENTLDYDPAEAGLSLKELGWVDQDGDPATPRVAAGVEGIQDGVTLALTLLAGDADSISLTVNRISADLGDCGIGVDVQQLPAASLLAPGPEGPVFGRQFDLAFFAWAAGNYQPCRLFLSGEIPGLYPEFPKGWGGVNASGFRDAGFDQACILVNTNLPDAEISSSAHQQLGSIFQEHLPALPLFFRQDILVAVPGLEGFDDDIYPLFGNIENIRPPE